MELVDIYLVISASGYHARELNLSYKLTTNPEEAKQMIGQIAENLSVESRSSEESEEYDEEKKGDESDEYDEEKKRDEYDEEKKEFCTVYVEQVKRAKRENSRRQGLKIPLFVRAAAEWRVKNFRTIGL